MRRLFVLLLVAVLALPGFVGRTPEPAYAAYTPPALKVALVRSTDSQAWVDKYGRGYGILYKEDILYNYLVSKGWDVTRISDDDLESLTKIKQYDVVVCMWVFAMTPSATNNMVKYVADGGGLVVPYASPRVAPGVGGSELEDHWVRIMNYEGWEWGPLSEVYQTYFIDDVGSFKFVARPSWGDPVVSGAATILQARGLSAADLTLTRNQNPGAWIEYARPLSGNTNTVNFMNLSQLSAPTGSTNYSISNGMGAARSTYLNGRSVYFYFSPTDFVFNQDGSGNQTVPTGVKQSEIAGAYIESAIVWAASTGGRPGVLVRDGRTYATLNVYQDGIYASHYVTNLGNVTVSGTLTYRIYDPAGRLVKTSSRYKIGVEPGKTYRYSESYSVGKLSAGSYRVEVEYLTTYPAYERRYVEAANVYRGQGTGIRTNRDVAKTAGQIVYDPRIVRSAGNNRYDTSLAIADAAGGYPRAERTVVIASGSGPDALVGSSIAGAWDAPLILTDVAALPANTDSWLRSTSRGFDKAIIIGGQAAVSSAVENRLKQIFGAADVTRLAGADRYETSAEVARAVKAKRGKAYDGGMIIAYGQAL
ncbi:MAG: cell wall-binding repeat-containing protein, partial [Coriobacteriia bacterium]|nr:cell wall-binding repeat-containing protein [Coriobacteriia bacterium]